MGTRNRFGCLKLVVSMQIWIKSFGCVGTINLPSRNRMVMVIDTIMTNNNIRQ